MKSGHKTHFDPCSPLPARTNFFCVFGEFLVVFYDDHAVLFSEKSCVDVHQHGFEISPKTKKSASKSHLTPICSCQLGLENHAFWRFLAFLTVFWSKMVKNGQKWKKKVFTFLFSCGEPYTFWKHGAEITPKTMKSATFGSLGGQELGS